MMFTPRKSKVMPDGCCERKKTSAINIFLKFLGHWNQCEQFLKIFSDYLATALLAKPHRLFDYLL